MSGGGHHPDDASVLRLLDPSTDDRRPRDRPPRIVGVLAHPDDEVFCVGGTLARCAAEGADTAVVALTRGEAGEILNASIATRGTLGDVRPALHCKVAALAAHRSQNAMAPDTFPHAVLDRLLGTEYFVVAHPADATRLETPR